MTYMADRRRIVIMGAAGRDFHNFNVVYRDDPAVEVVAFTAAQIPDIAGRRYPPGLSGGLYPDGIPIVDEAQLTTICRDQSVEQVVFAYSDLPNAAVMDRASIALAAGADFVLLGPDATMLKAGVPVVAVSAVRTGCGKSQTTRWLAARLHEKGRRVAVIRHPMPYGDLARQAVQRFATQDDIDAADCTIEEREEYEPYIELGRVIFAGVDYQQILRQAETEADIILWDGGNNDFPFVRPDLHIVLVDPLRAGDEISFFPGEAVLRMADIVVVAKTNSATAAQISDVTANARRLNPNAPVIRAASPVRLDDPGLVAGKRVLVIDDGPTITHGGMAYGAGYVAAEAAGAASFSDPRDHADADILAVYAAYPHIGHVLPAMGYSAGQLAALERTIKASDAEVIVAGTPCDLDHLIDVPQPIVRARYKFAEAQSPGLMEEIDRFLAG